MFRDEKGQITVYLSLLFFVIIGICFCSLEGIRSYLQSSLAEDAYKGAGNYVLANYDRALFDRYHLFFLDPREKNKIISHGKQYMRGYFNKGSFFDFSCSRLDITEEKTAVDEDGLYLKHQIREWMKYREAAKAGQALRQLFDAGTGSRQCADGVKDDMGKAKKAIADEASKNAENASKQEVQNASDRQGNYLPENVKQDEIRKKENTKQAIQWKTLSNTLKYIMKSGILLYVASDNGELSGLSISYDNLPSREKGYRQERNNIFASALSFVKAEEWGALLDNIQIEKADVHMLTDGYYLLNYIEDSFSCYTGQMKEKTALNYEMEYLIGGNSSDIDNLKLTVNRILCLRFLVNYAYISQNSEWKTVSHGIAGALTGVFGMPQAQKAVQVLLTAAISFGESVLDICALLKGEKIPVWKNAATWNLTMENAAVLLKNKGPVKKGKKNVGYVDYLQFLLSAPVSSEKYLYRMLDMMQVNTALAEPGFLMKDSLFSFRWEAKVDCKRWFSFFPGTGISGNRNFQIDMEKVVSY